jgi:hypothetical protein
MYALSQFYCIFFCYFPLIKPGLRHLYSCPVFQVSSFKGPNRVGACLPTHLRTETDPVCETLCSLGFTISDDGQVQKPDNSE